ncbi:hypothetical protein BRADI_3g42524v3 [Brachypodium distachyon]|uniref:Knottin scorpion toxin-like domain-containing protein n=1 Tax=Brachypodium distachyon TaxID=15368 RepID=A0A0Q3FM72_BRADI|nr:hypothetical protein BRADI_3g42524v3 [Brachypodium distachyon]
MRATQRLLLTLAFLVLASDAVMKASTEGRIQPEYCTTMIIPSRVPCDPDACDNDCYKNLHGGGMCNSVGCLCAFCENIPPEKRSMPI